LYLISPTKKLAGFIVFPLVVHTLDLVVSAIGIWSVRERPSPSAPPKEDPYTIMKGGYAVSLGLAAVGFTTACRCMLHVERAPSAWMHFAACGLVGMATAVAYVAIAQYYTDYKYAPVRSIAEAGTTGHATNIIAGVGVGLEAVALPVLVMAFALVASYWLGNTSGLVDSNADGLFGTAVATMGMLSTAAYVLTMDIFGPIADNAGGIVEMSQQPESVRDVTDLLDAVGNTTKATTKGYAIGSAGLASFLLFTAYLDEVSTFTGEPFNKVDIAIPEVFVGGLLGAALVFLFSSWACAAVGSTAQEVVAEVRRQFAERRGIMTYQEKPDYARCVAIVAASALRAMVRPGLLAVLAPCAVGMGFKALGAATGQELLGAKAVAGMMMFATVTGEGEGGAACFLPPPPAFFYLPLPRVLMIYVSSHPPIYPDSVPCHVCRHCDGIIPQHRGRRLGQCQKVHRGRRPRWQGIGCPQGGSYRGYSGRSFQRYHGAISARGHKAGGHSELGASPAICVTLGLGTWYWYWCVCPPGEVINI
jgi:H+-translocating diphosphatase